MLALALLVAVGTVAPIGGGNALTLPAARHIVRIEPGGGRPAALLLALQQDGAQGHMLDFLRSDDNGATWRHYAPIQDTRNDRDTVDMVVSGKDIAVVFSYEGPTLAGSTAHDVFFQWWRFDGVSDWKPQPAIRIFDSASASTAFYRGLVARDSVGRIWVQAFELRPDGSSRAAIAVSSNAGASFTRLPDLAVTAARGGGRLIHLGNRMMFLWGTHRFPDVASMRFHDDAADPATWSSAVTALPEGIYHGAALSAVADGQGGLHLVYKDGSVRLFYRRFDGKTWGPRTLLDSTADWATQPATTLIGGQLFIFYNHAITTNTNYTFVYRILRGGTMSGPTTLRSTQTFKGYPASVDTLPSSIAQVPCVFGDTFDASSAGNAAIVFGTNSATTPPPPPPPPSGSILFSDQFQRTDLASLGGAWTVVQGGWQAKGSYAASGLNGGDRALAAGVTCADCHIDCKFDTFGVEGGLVLRSQPNGDRYEMVLVSTGAVQVRRWRGGVATVLGSAPSGIPNLGAWTPFAFSARGAGPVSLTVSVNGILKLDVEDSSPQAITGAGGTGMHANIAGVVFDDFVVTTP
jgi:hypothetical protein